MRLHRFAAVLLLLSFAAPALAGMQTRPVDWKVGDRTFSGVLVFDDANAVKRPGLVMVPNWMGVTPAAVARAGQIAGSEYVVLVADVYGKGERPKDSAQAAAMSKPLRDDRALLRTRIEQAVDVLRKQATDAPLDAGRIGALGFCFGGTTVLELARAGSHVAGVVSLHGGLSTPLPAKSGAVKTAVLVLNGASDPNVTAADIAAFEHEMDAAGADWQFVNFSGAVHCFAEDDANSPPGCVYNERAAKRAYEMLRDFFRERFAVK
ncbi:MAG TPA: dienelactone hydrolase family protein [Lysobacter sp.]|nr:dienelactone hydrolase family protein [Lysobacter sp.]